MFNKIFKMSSCKDFFFLMLSGKLFELFGRVIKSEAVEMQFVYGSLNLSFG